MTAPVVGTPTVVFGSGRVNETAPLRIIWLAFDPASGVALPGPGQRRRQALRNDLQRPGTSVRKSSRSARPLVFRVRATDNEGNVSGWISSATRKIAAIQNSNPSVKYAGNWHGIELRASSGRGYSFASDKGSRAGATFKGRSVLYVAPKTKLSGYVKVYVDGALIGRFKLRSATLVNGNIVTRFSWAANGRHRIRIVNDINGQRTNLDAFIVLK